MEVVVTAATAPASPDFHFVSDSGTNSPYATAPPSPKPFGNPAEYFYCYASAPASPTRAAAVYSYFAGGNLEEKKPVMPGFGSYFGFADLGPGDTDGEAVSTADELFDKGPLKPPTHPPPPRPTCKNSGSTAAERAGRERSSASPPVASSSRSDRRETRSLSPLRGGGALDVRKPPPSSPSASSAPAGSSSAGRGGSKKWRLRDLLLFRSASEGRATGTSKDPLRKYTLLSSSFDRRRSGGESKGGSSGKAGAASAHEQHYAANRAAAEERKKKTALPYRRNTFFGWLHFNPGGQSAAGGFNGGSLNRGGR